MIKKKSIVDEIKDEKKYKDITRFISTHPDGDHVQGLKRLFEYLPCLLPGINILLDLLKR